MGAGFGVGAGFGEGADFGAGIGVGVDFGVGADFGAGVGVVAGAVLEITKEMLPSAALMFPKFLITVQYSMSTR